MDLLTGSPGSSISAFPEKVEGSYAIYFPLL